MNTKSTPSAALSPETIWYKDEPTFRAMLQKGLLNDFDRLPAALFEVAPPPCYYWGEMSASEELRHNAPVTGHEWITREMVESGQVVICDASDDPQGKEPAGRMLAHRLGWLQLRHSAPADRCHWVMQHRVSLSDAAEKTDVSFTSMAKGKAFFDGTEIEVHVADQVTITCMEHSVTMDAASNGAVVWYSDSGCEGTLVIVGEPNEWEVARMLGNFYNDDGYQDERLFDNAGDTLGNLVCALRGAPASHSLQSLLNATQFKELPNAQDSLNLVINKDGKLAVVDASALRDIATLLSQEGDQSSAIVAALRPLVQALAA